MSATMEPKEILQYVPFTSFVHPSFWHTFTELKLDVDKLNETTKEIYGRFTIRVDIGPVFEVDGRSFNRDPDIDRCYENVTGTIINKNTIEDFKNINKAELLNSFSEMLWAKIKTKTWITTPSDLIHFLILSYSDLKKFHYYYWFAFPCPSQPTVLVKERDTLECCLNDNQMHQLVEGYNTLDATQKPFFIILKKDEDLFVNKLSDVLDVNPTSQVDVDLTNTYFTFADPSNGTNPGWPLRLFLAALIDHCPSFINKEIKVIALRWTIPGTIFDSRVFIIKIPQDVKSVESAGWVGWERNVKGNFGPRFVNMSSSMNAVTLAETSADLNIKLMKWRLVPDLDVKVMGRTKCLLLGAGTLGCHVARNLLAWGFRDITLLDSGSVSFSNPTRQSLYNFQDCNPVNRKKAEIAARNLRNILPAVNSRGIVAHIPMPGHPVGESMKNETLANISTLEDAIRTHDVIFLLLDTREARWLPTLIGADLGKIVINAALGFDSYLVMRHGVGLDPEPTSPPTSPSSKFEFLPGGQLGCYFCNDVTAPGNSTRDRTLDQQCTVTRPGAAAIAGALAVELLVGLLQHPSRSHAPAVYNLNREIFEKDNVSGVLGPVPHSIRGSLYDHQSFQPTTAKFKQCIACSDIVINKYREEGIEFVLKVLDSRAYLEEVTGLNDLQLTAEIADILTLSDSEHDDE